MGRFHMNCYNGVGTRVGIGIVYYVFVVNTFKTSYSLFWEYSSEMEVHKTSYSENPKNSLSKSINSIHNEEFYVYGYIKRIAMISKIEFNMKKSEITSRNIDMQNF